MREDRSEAGRKEDAPPERPRAVAPPPPCAPGYDRHLRRDSSCCRQPGSGLLWAFLEGQLWDAPLWRPILGSPRSGPNPGVGVVGPFVSKRALSSWKGKRESVPAPAFATRPTLRAPRPLEDLLTVTLPAA